MDSWTVLSVSIQFLITAQSVCAIDLDLPVTFPHIEDFADDHPIRLITEDGQEKEFKSYQPPCPKDKFRKYGQCNETDFITRLRYCDELNAILLKSEVKYRDPHALEGPQPCLGVGDDNLFDTTQIQEMIEIYQEAGIKVGGDGEEEDDERTDDEETPSEAPHRRVKRNSKLIRDFKINRWDMPIKYKIDGYLAAYGEKTIKTALHEWEKKTCVRFEEIDVDTLPNEQHLVFLPTASRVCYSYIGKTRTGEEDLSQPIFLSYLCMTKGILEHEIGHSLGLIHEHQRPDRDKYVRILEENVRSTARGLFSTIPNKFIDTRKIPYDYTSNMHYTGVAFSVNGNHTIETKDKRFQPAIGQRVELTFWDMMAVNMAYCDHICNGITLDRPCDKNGYQDPNNCSRCLCPDGWSGPFCDEVAPPVGDFCGGHILIQGTDKSYLQSPNYGSGGTFNYYDIGQECSWLITAPEGKRIVLQFEGDIFSIFCYEKCLHWVEIRYGDDLGANGPRFCCYEKPDDLMLSTTNQVMVLLRAKDDFPVPHERQGFKLSFRTDGDECASQPCYNGGFCTDGIAEYRCSCPWPYTGRRCENSVSSFCSGQPCQNGGTCISGRTGYYCRCLWPYTGENCESGPEAVLHQWKSAATAATSTTTSSTTSTSTTSTTTTTTKPTTTTTTATTTTPTTTTTSSSTTTATTPTTRPSTTTTTTTAATTPTTNPTTTKTIPTTASKPTTLAPSIKRSEDNKIKMDIMFVLDISNRTGKDIQCYKTFLKQVIERLHFGQSATRIGLITLSRLARTVSNLNDHWFVDGLLRDLDQQRLDSASTCDYYNAIWLLLTDSYTDTNGARKEAPDVAVILTDNRPSERHLDIYKGIKRKATERLREKGINVFAVGVGNAIDVSELLQITGTERHYYHPDNCLELNTDRSVIRMYNDINNLASEVSHPKKSAPPNEAASTSNSPSTVTSHPSRPVRKETGSLLTRILRGTSTTVPSPTTRATSKATAVPRSTTTKPSATDNSNTLPRCWWEQVGPCSEACGGCGRKKMVFFCMSTSGSKRIYGQLWESCNSQACPKYCDNGRGSKNWVCGTQCCNSTYKQVDGICVKKKQ